MWPAKRKKDWSNAIPTLALLISLISLFVSGATFIVANFYHYADIGVIVSGPLVSVDIINNKKMKLSVAPTFNFINNGNVSVSILWMTMYFDMETDDPNLKGSAVASAVKFDAFVIKSGEVIIRNIEFNSDEVTGVDVNKGAEAKFSFERLKTMRGRLEINMAIPSVGEEKVAAELDAFQPLFSSKNGGASLYIPSSGFFSKSPRNYMSMFRSSWLFNGWLLPPKPPDEFGGFRIIKSGAPRR